jgi:hypothetical protein
MEPAPAPMIDRREAIRRVSLLLGGVALASETALLGACRPRTVALATPEATLFGRQEIALLDEIAETILPETDTPGAKAAQVGAYMAVIVTDCYAPRDQQVFRDGLATVDRLARERYGREFLDATPAERLALAEELDREQKTYTDNRQRGAPPHFFRLMKELTLSGYFTSELGMTRALRYVEAPGRYDPCVPYQPGETIWAGHA